MYLSPASRLPGVIQKAKEYNEELALKRFYNPDAPEPKSPDYETEWLKRQSAQSTSSNASIPGYKGAPEGTVDNTRAKTIEISKPGDMTTPKGYYNRAFVKSNFCAPIPKSKEVPDGTVDNTRVKTSALTKTLKPEESMAKPVAYDPDLARKRFDAPIPELQYPQPQRTSPYSPVDRSPNVSPSGFNDNALLTQSRRNSLERTLTPSNE